MRIVKMGKLPEDELYQGKCLHCGTEVEFARKEGTVTYDQREGDYIMVKCPVCTGNIYADLQERIR